MRIFRNTLCVTFMALMWLSLRVLASPIVNQIAPYYGPSSGGSSVTISGEGFTGTTAVYFGNKLASHVTVVSDNEIVAVSPSHVPRCASVSVTTADGSSFSSQDTQFVFQGDWMAYVSNNTDNTVSVIDATDASVIPSPQGTITVGGGPVATAATPDGSKIFVLNLNSNSVSVIDAATGSAISTITVGLNPLAVAITPDGTQAFVSNYGDGSNPSTVSVIDIPNNSLYATVTVGVEPTGIAITPDGKNVYVVIQGDNQMGVLSTGASPQLIRKISDASFNNPVIVDITPSGAQALVANFSGNSISVIDTQVHSVVASVTVGDSPVSIIITPDNLYAYVSNFNSNSVSVISLNPIPVLVNTLAVGAHPTDLAITPDGKTIFVANYGDSSVSVIDTTLQRVSSTITVGSHPVAVDVTPDGKKVYVVNVGSHSLSVIEIGQTPSVIATLPVGQNPYTIAIQADQAPLAKFVSQQGLVIPSFEVSFDASSSISPTGSISKYTWDFGDGTPTVTTENPMVTHTYTSLGSYEVSLVVINSSNTSLFQSMSMETGGDYFGSQGAWISHNGGSTAKMTKTLQVTKPWITGFSPAKGLTTGGTEVKIYGANLQNTTNVWFGKHPVRVLSVSPDGDLVTVIAPHGSGNVEVTVMGSSESFNVTAASKFSYVPESPQKGRIKVQGRKVTLFWEAPTSSHPSYYEIYADSSLTQKVATVKAKRGQKRYSYVTDRTADVYYIVSADRPNHLSDPLVIGLCRRP